MQDRNSPEHNTLSSQVLEYFRNYSGNQNLSTYLRGIVPIRNIEQGESPVAEEQQRPPLIGQDRIDPTINNTNEVLQNPSPTSSVASNRKLEWDNGADIGYENSSKQSLHKSVSLPILSTLERIEPGKKPLRQSPEGNVAEASTQIYYHLTSSSSGSSRKSLPTSSSSELIEGRKIDSTTSSSFVYKLENNDSENSEINVEERDEILEFIHKKVGNPIAESTPGFAGIKACRRLVFSASEDSVKTLENSGDSKSSSTVNMVSNELDLSNLRCVAKFAKKRVTHLAVTKPITVECMNYKESRDKDIQTSLNSIKTRAIAVQTDDNSRIIEHHILPVYEDRQIIEFMKYSESSDEPGLRSLGTNTYSDAVASNCNSFEYIYPDDVQKNDNSKSSQTLSSNVTEASSKTTPLGEMISCNISCKDKSVDVEKSVALLHRLLKSKRYDKITKQYYVKKIVEKILKSNSSATSPNNIESSSSKVSENIVEPSVNQRLQENVPWVPAPPKKHLETQTFTTEILPDKQNVRKLKDSRFTITSSLFNPAKQTNLAFDKNMSTSNSSSNEKSQKSFRNWKNNVTQSEKAFEGRIKCDGDKLCHDVLLKFAKKERENQINWINNEISHLNKLRNLLEEDKKPKVEIDVLTKPHVEDMKNLKKSASVYVITTDKSKPPTPKKPPLKPFINPNLKEAKLISSEIYKTEDPYGSVRRYVFEIPIDCGCNNEKCTHFKKELQKKLADCICQSGPCADAKKQLKDCTCQNEQCMTRKKQSQTDETEKLDAGSIASPDVNSIDTQCDVKSKTSHMSTMTDELKYDNKLIGHDIDSAIDAASFTEYLGVDKASNHDKQLGSSKSSSMKPSVTSTGSMTEAKKFDTKKTGYSSVPPKDKGSNTDNNMFSKGSLDARFVAVDNSLQAIAETSNKSVQSIDHPSMEDAEVQSMNQRRVSIDTEYTTDLKKIKVKSQSDYNSAPPRNQESRAQNYDIETNVPVSKETSPQMLARSNSRGQNYETESRKSHKQRNYHRVDDTSDDRQPDSRLTSDESSREYRKDRKKQQLSSSSSPSTSSSEQSVYLKICPCCRQGESKYKSMVKGLPQEIEEALCKPCCMNTQMKMNPYTGRYTYYPGHICNCYTLLKTETVNKIKSTVKQLENLEDEDQYCSCSQRRCTCQEFGRSRKGIAYTLTLEDDYPSPYKEVLQRRSLDEIKLKIPSFKKKHRSKRHESTDRKHKHRKKKEKGSSKMTLQEYLNVNRPNFVQNAEERRKAMIDLAFLREERCQKYKQLLALTKGNPPVTNVDKATAAKGLFSNKEMKQITAKTYKKLPEVQKKLADRRDNDIKKANRILADMFNKKVQQNTLKGKLTIPTTASVIKFI